MAFRYGPPHAHHRSNRVRIGNERYTDYPMAMGVLTTIFFMWGFLTCLNDILIPHLKSTFQLSYAQVMLVQFTFFRRVFSDGIAGRALVAAWVTRKASLPDWRSPASVHWVSGPLRPAFVSRISRRAVRAGDRHHRACRSPPIRTWRCSAPSDQLQPADPGAGTEFAGHHAGALVRRPADSVQRGQKPGRTWPSWRRHEQLATRPSRRMRCRGRISGLAVVLFLLAIFVWLFRLPALTEATDKDDHAKHMVSMKYCAHPHVLFGVLGIFFYVGAEVSIGSFMVNYLSMPDIGHMSEQQAAHYVSYYWGGAMVGRFVGSALMAKISPRKLLAIFAAINALLVLTTMLSSGNVAMSASSRSACSTRSCSRPSSRWASNGWDR
jgi:FHS family L-fucose permease-like MFS transporter